MENSKLTLEEFKRAWLSEIKLDEPTTVETGRRFLKKIVSQYLDIEDDDYNLKICDGPNDGGIDAAYLKVAEKSEDGDKWYIFQSKFGSSLKSSDIIVEANKLIDTLTGRNSNVNAAASDVVDRIMDFYNSSSNNDKLIFVLTTSESLLDNDRDYLENIIRNYFRACLDEKMKASFQVECISIETIYNKIQDDKTDEAKRKIPINAQLVQANDELLVGSVKLEKLYLFLKDSKKAAKGDLDLLYQKNVRRYLGSNRAVNKAMRKTLKDEPQRFGLYNNGITIVVKDYQNIGSDKYILVEPFIVNGCQTTRSIWEVFDKQMNSGGTGINIKLENWKKEINNAIVVVKIVKVGFTGTLLLNNTTKYTNSQNRVSQKDFIALESKFQIWQKEMEEIFDIFLEIQRGEKTSRKALEKRLKKPPCKDYVNAFDLIKVYGAGWKLQAGTAFRSNAPFVPGGSIFKEVVDEKNGFGVDDLYAAYLLHKYGIENFGRKADKSSRKQTKFLFYQTVIEILTGLLQKENLPSGHKDISNSIRKLWKENNKQAKNLLIDSSLYVIDTYMSLADEFSFRKEDSYDDFLGDLNAFLKSRELGKGAVYSYLIRTNEKDMRRRSRDGVVASDVITQAIKETDIIEYNNNFTNSSTGSGRITLKNLLDNQIIPVGFIAYRTYRKHGYYEAVVLKDGRVKIEGIEKIHDSINRAAKYIKDGGHENIWDTWRGRDESGKDYPLRYFRQKFRDKVNN